MKALVVEKKEALEQAAQQLLQWSKGGKKWAFVGEIGAGKTSLIQALCIRLGVEQEVLSPTFSLVNEYGHPAGRIYHIDLYRLHDLEEALDIGIENYLYDDQYCFIEWPQLVEDLLPEDTIFIKLEIIGDSARKILFLANEDTEHT
ncbi:MAG TPA: tRNA (adenosine(37)-N6)-threonylcarbamoyltransferase complex ATPase subunit type 1 TsaE [Saprospiraceae bacterium]|nr:tRNA (adenosine(37)-N6)-threonylcarbamoyltransferase complex ATPase subunit type 1 TsaE [Saprospiraceae bacterium]HMQ83821.1 tRNA (adenosine(37)-N6)-threonylcarbamoyltransferase complex ATPase subunit type 1 TsaE [Saprospiraceae bacterium]